MKQLLLASILILSASFYATGQCNFDPTITADPANPDFTYCPGDLVTLSTEEYDSYQWYYNFTNSNTGGTLISGATEQQFVVDISSWGFAYFYVEATLDDCTEASPTQLIDSWVFLFPVIQSEGQSTFCEGDSTEILMPSPGVFKYQWYRDGTPIPGANQQNYWVKESGTYVVEVAYEQCPEFWLSSGVGPTFTFLEVTFPNVALSGDTLMADSGLQWQWLLDGQPIAGATGSSWVAQESGMYSLRFTDANGCEGETPPVAVTISSTTEISALAIRTYPNPVRDALFVESDLPLARIRLLDQQGRVLWDAEPAGSGEAHIPMDRFSAGTYGLQVLLADGRQWTRVVVKGL